MKRTNKLSRLAGLIFLMTIMLFIGSCSEKGTATQPGQQLQIKIDTSRMGLASMEQLEYFILTVTGPGISTPIEGVMVLFEGYLVGEIIVPPGVDRLFALRAFDIDGRLIYYGETTADVGTDSDVIININLYPQVQMVKLTPRFMQIPQGSDFGLDVKIYNINHLNTVTVNIVYNNERLTFERAELDTSLTNLAWLEYTPLGMPGFAFMVGSSNEVGSIVDDSGYVTLATVYFKSYAYEPEIVVEDFIIDYVALTNTSFETIPADSVYFDGSQVEIYRPSFSTVAYWSMDDDMLQNIVYDSSPNKLNGTAFGTYLETGYHGNARVFDGFSDYVEVPDNDLLDIDAEITVSMYVFFNVDQSGGVLFSKRVPDGDINYQIRMQSSFTSANDILMFEYGTPPGHIYQTTGILRDNAYHHLAISFKYGDPSSALWMIDGQVRPGVWTTGNGTAATTVNTYPLQMGRQLSGETNDYFMGALDEISLSNKALDSIMIELLRNQIMIGKHK